MEVNKMVEENKFVEFEKLRHNNQKEIIGLKDVMDEKRHRRKLDFTSYLYDLKNKFLDKEEKNKRERIQLLFQKQSALANVRNTNKKVK